MEQTNVEQAVQNKTSPGEPDVVWITGEEAANLLIPFFQRELKFERILDPCFHLSELLNKLFNQNESDKLPIFSSQNHRIEMGEFWFKSDSSGKDDAKIIESHLFRLDDVNRFLEEKIPIHLEELVNSKEKFPGEPGGKSNGEGAPTNTPEPQEDGYIRGNKKLEAAFDLTMNTIKERAKEAGVSIEKDFDGRNKIKATDIVKMKAEHPRYSRKTKK